MTSEDGKEHFLSDYYPDEISFNTAEFIGLELKDAHSLKFKKDVAYSRS